MSVLEPDLKRGVLELDDRGSDFLPEDWRRSIYEVTTPKRYPITTLMDRMGNRITTSRYIHWPSQPYNPMCGSVVDVYTTKPDAGSPVAYTSGGAKNDTLYVAISPADARGLLESDVVLLSSESTFGYLRAIVTAVNIAGEATSYLTVRLLQADTSALLANADLRWTNIGRAENEQWELPEPLYEEAIWYHNDCQIISDAVALTERQIKERERVDPDIRARMKKQSLNRIQRKRERMRLFGYNPRESHQDANTGKTYCMGLHQFLGKYAPENLRNYSTDPIAAGKTALEGTLDYLRTVDEVRSRYSQADHVWMFTSGLVLNLIDACVMDNSHYHIDGTQSVYGVRYKTLRGLRQDIRLVEHPDFSVNPALQRLALLTEISLLKNVALFPLEYIPAGTNKEGLTWSSVEKSGWRVDESIEIDNPTVHMFIDGLGLPNTYGT